MGVCFRERALHSGVEITCPSQAWFGREGPLGCHVLPHVLLAMDKQLPPERVVLCTQHSYLVPRSLEEETFVMIPMYMATQAPSS